jgi:hypothetical protein
MANQPPSTDPIEKALAEPWLLMLENKDTLLDMYRTQLEKQDALIRELLAALVKVRYGPVTIEEYEAVLANAKAAGFEP